MAAFKQLSVKQSLIDIHCSKACLSVLWQKQWPPGFILHKSGCRTVKKEKKNHLLDKWPAAATFSNITFFSAHTEREKKTLCKSIRIFFLNSTQENIKTVCDELSVPLSQITS